MKINVSDIGELIALKQEGSYWDFKREWYGNDSKGKMSMLHDIICMANNLSKRDGYIIIGVDESEDFSVVGVRSDENRRNTQNIVDFLRGKKFGGGYRPTITVATLCFGSLEIDVIVVHSDYNTPYYLSEQVYGLCPNNIYTRVQDTNTPANGSADYHHVEALWKKRFGIDLPISERFLVLLDKVDEWSMNLDDLRPSYHKVFPEFTIQIDYDNDREGWEPQSPFYPDPKMYFAPLKLMYHRTIVYETGVISSDGYRLKLPNAQESVLEISLTNNELSGARRYDGDLHYYFYDLAEIPGKLMRLFTGGTLNFHSRGFGPNLYLIFQDNAEHTDFRNFAHAHYPNIDVEALRGRFKYQLAQTYQGEPMEVRVMILVVVSELYDRWKAGISVD